MDVQVDQAGYFLRYIHSGCFFTVIRVCACTCVRVCVCVSTPDSERCLSKVKKIRNWVDEIGIDCVYTLS